MKKIFFIAAMLLFGAFTLETFAQSNPYQEFKTVDGVVIDYKWSHTKLFNKNSPLELRLRIRNTNEHAVSVVFSVDFFYKLRLTESSEDVELCILPGKWKTGRTNGVYFQPDQLTNKQIRSEDFHWDTSDMTVEVIETCEDTDDGEEEEG
jgi:hypothetical protein